MVINVKARKKRKKKKADWKGQVKELVQMIEELDAKLKKVDGERSIYKEQSYNRTQELHALEFKYEEDMRKQKAHFRKLAETAFFHEGILDAFVRIGRAEPKTLKDVESTCPDAMTYTHEELGGE